MEKLTPTRILVAVALGLAGAEAMWILQPVNNFYLNNSYIADNFLPELAVALILALVLVANPLIRWVRPAWALSVRQLALIFGILLVAAAHSQTLRIYPHALARGNREACQDAQLAEIHREMALPSSLYLDPVVYGAKAPVADQLFDRLAPGARIPWGRWLAPLLSWGTLIGAVWLTMAGLGLIVFPQWRDNERLPFPLLTVQQELIRTPEPGHRLPPIFHSRLFWAGCLLVVVLHGFNGLNHHTGGDVPPFPLGWNLWTALSEGLWRHLDWYAKSARIYFIFVGITFFMPNRVGFSLWFTFLAFQVHRMIGYEYHAPFNVETVGDYRNGATLSVALIILWLGRRQWQAVAQAMFRRGGGEVTARDRAAGWMFATGLAVLLGWLLWAGAAPGWALAFVVMTVVTALILARIVCETGLPFAGIHDFGPVYFMRLMPLRWLDHASIWLGGFLNMILAAGGSRTSAAVLFLHGLGMDREAGPRHQVRVARLLFGVLLLGIVLCGVTHLAVGYRHATTLGGMDSPVSSWGSAQVLGVQDDLRMLQRGAWHARPYSQGLHFLVGAGLGAGLQVACLISPGWPLHPVGLLLAGSWFHGVAWASILLGWGLKMVTVKYGGAQAYRTAKPFFLGLVIGEVVSLLIWAATPLALIWLGGDPAEVGRILVLPQ